MFRTYIALAALLIWSGSVLAADGTTDYTDFDLEELMQMDVVYGASTYEQKVSEAPSAVTVVTADEIEAYGYRTLGDVLTSVAGFYVTNDRNYSHVGVRGFNRPGDYDSRLLVLVDGHVVNDNIYLSSSPGTAFPLELDLIRRVEIIRGPSSSLYGSNAFFGVINIVTKEAGDLEGGQLVASLGTLADYGGKLAYGKETASGLNYVLAGSISDISGEDLYFPEFDSPGTNNGVFARGDYDRSRRLLAKLNFGEFYLQALYGTREKGVPTAAWETIFNDNRTRTIDTYAYVDLNWRHAIGDQSELSVRGTYDHYGYDGWYPYDAAEEGEDPWVVMNRDEALGRKLALSARWTGNLGSLQRLVVGSEVRHNQKRWQNYYDEAPDYWLYLDRDDPSSEVAAFLQDELQISGRLRLSLGVRYDRYRRFESTNPRLGLMVAAGHGATFKALYGTAFRAPNAYEMYYSDEEYWQKGNPDLLPEEMESWELIWEQNLNDRVSSNLSFFHYDIDNLISQIFDPSDGLMVFQNIDRVTSDGLEVGLDARLLSRVRGRVSYSRQETRDRSNDAILSNSPQHLAKLNILTPLSLEGATAGLEMLYMSDRKTMAGGVSKSHLLTNLTLGKKNFLRGLDATLTMFNLLDTVYADPGSLEHVQDLVPREGRTLRLKLLYSW